MHNVRKPGDFRLKLLAGFMAVALGDALIWAQLGPFGGLMLALPPLAMVTRPALRRDRRAWVWLGLATVMAFALIYRPGPIAWCLFWIYVGIGTLIPVVRGFGDAWQWAQRLAQNGLRSTVAPLLDLRRCILVKARRGGPGLGHVISLLALPVIGSAVIIVLFTAANPVIATWLNRLFGAPWSTNWVGRIVVWLILFAMAWSVLRPRVPFRVFGTFDDGGQIKLPGISVASVRTSLIAFNALFAMQNAMDLAWLWGLVPLPRGMTLAEYAHHGAYPLIVTALLAAGFVLVALRPGSITAAQPAIRRLVVLWIAQNVLLVASAALRTLDYVAAYSLTALRIAALLWMVLVALGLVLVCWRMIRGKSASWLINANAAAALALLSVCCFVDLEEVAVQYNINHARELGGNGPPLDICYLLGVGPSGLLPLAGLEQRRAPEAIHLWARLMRHNAQTWLAADQTSGNWSLLGALRLASLPVGPSQVRPSALPPACNSRSVHELRVALGMEAVADRQSPSPPLTAAHRP